MSVAVTVSRYLRSEKCSAGTRRLIAARSGASSRIFRDQRPRSSDNRLAWTTSRFSSPPTRRIASSGDMPEANIAAITAPIEVPTKFVGAMPPAEQRLHDADLRRRSGTSTAQDQHHLAGTHRCLFSARSRARSYRSCSSGVSGMSRGTRLGFPFSSIATKMTEAVWVWRR